MDRDDGPPSMALTNNSSNLPSVGRFQCPDFWLRVNLYRYISTRRNTVITVRTSDLVAFPLHKLPGTWPESTLQVLSTPQCESLIELQIIG